MAGSATAYAFPAFLYKHTYFASIEKKKGSCNLNTNFSILHQYSRLVCGQMKKPVDTHSQESNSRRQNCEADALPHDHGFFALVVSLITYLMRIKGEKRKIAK